MSGHWKSCPKTLPWPECDSSTCNCPAGQQESSGTLPYGKDYTCEHGEPPADCPQCNPVAADVFVDVAALLAGGIPDKPPPVLLTRDDGHALFYAGKVNVLFGDPECGKTWIALAACVEAMRAGRRAAIVDLDHNGAEEIVSRLLALGATPAMLSDPNRFRLAEPEESDELILVVAELRRWRPAAAVVDSIGELLPMLGLSSNSPDDYTSANRRVLTPLANAGAAVIAIDHMPKNDEARQHGQTGTAAKKRTVNGVSLRVSVAEPFVPGRGGSANMVIHKDRPGGVRAHSPVDGKSQPAGRFVMSPGPGGSLDWHVTKPIPSTDSAPTSDVAELDALNPPPKSQRDVQERMKWGAKRAMDALREWRKRSAPSATASHSTSGEAGSSHTHGVSASEAPGEALRSSSSGIPINTGEPSSTRPWGEIDKRPIPECGHLPGDYAHQVNCVNRDIPADEVARFMNLDPTFVADVRARRAA